MSGIIGHVGSKSGVIGELTNPYINAATKATIDQISGNALNANYLGFKLLGIHNSGSTGVTLQSGACGIIIGQHNDGGTWNRRIMAFWKRCNGGASYADCMHVVHESGNGSTGAMSLGIDGSHVVTISGGSGTIYVYVQTAA